ncbi:M24 family metallopeptidase [Alteribacillus sp. JSM 102045]|uniref:M24 family metallopeptidase n=1 Tax=Alteribacillus sp. JSM 102045 TaxID=1562101 RepID=UPI0035C0C496
MEILERKLTARLRTDLPFPIEEYERRVNDVRKELNHRSLDAMMITNPENIFYLTGFETTGYMCYQALFIPVEPEPFIVTRVLEDTGVQALSWLEHSFPHIDSEDPFIRTKEALEQFNLHTKKIGYERDSWFLTVSQQDKLFSLVRDAVFVDCAGLIEELRLIKSEAELEKIKEAVLFTEAALNAGIDAAEEGVKDNDISSAMHYAMIKAGSDYPAVQPYVATGPRSAVGHATWSGRTLEQGDCVFLEVAGCKHRYHAACMRTGFIGKPSPDQVQAEKIIREAVDTTIDVIKAGVKASEIDAVSRNIISRNKLGLQQLARSLYSIGIAFAPGWDEGHIFSCHPGEHRELQPNMVFHLIPWGLVPGKFAMGLSETIRVTEASCEVLTRLPRSSFIK